MTIKRAPFSKPLPGRVDPYPDEPPYGLFLRTCEYNGVDQPYTNFWRAGLDTGQAVSDLAVERVAFLCSQEPAAISAAAPAVTTSNVRMGAETIHRDQFSVLHRRWCPACMAEAAHHRVWWDVLPIAACPDHGLRLTSACGCARKPLWKSTPTTECRRGHAFERAERVPASDDEIAFAGYVRDRLLGRPRAPHPLLDDLALGEALRVCERIGKASIDETRRHSRSKDDRDGLAAEGFRVLGDFAPRIADVFDRLLAASAGRKGARQWGVERAYGDFYIWTANYPGGSAFVAAIKAAVAAHAERNVTLKSGHDVAGVAVAPRGGMDMTSAAAEWGVTFERFRRLASAVGLIAKTSLRGRPARLDPDAVRTWADRIRNAKTRQEIAAELRIAPHAAGRLIAAGFLPAMVDGQKEADNRLNVWLLPGNAATNLVARLHEVARPPSSDADRAKLLPISIVARMARAPLARLLGLAFDGKLPIQRDPAGAGLEGFLVRKGDAQVAVRCERVPGMTITEAGRALGLHADMMAQLRGTLLTTEKIGRMHSVSPDEIKRFAAAYATSEQLAREFKLPRGSSAIAALRDEGVEPLYARPAYRQALFDRATATVALERRRDRAPAPKRGRGDLDAAAFAKAVGIDRLLVRQLVDAGVVEGKKIGKRYAIPPSQVVAFKAAFATAAELGPSVGGNHTAAIAILAPAGVEPFVGPPKFYAALYTRAEAEIAIALHFATLNAERASKTRAVKDDEPRLKSRDACDFLGCTDMMLTQLRTAPEPLIQAERQGAKYVYRQSELNRFKARYVFGSELGTMIGRPGADGGKAMTMVVMNLGVRPVCARPEFISYLFERSATMEALKNWDGVTNRWSGRVAKYRHRSAAS